MFYACSYCHIWIEEIQLFSPSNFLNILQSYFKSKGFVTSVEVDHQGCEDVMSVTM